MAKYLHEHQIAHESWSPLGASHLKEMVKIHLVQTIAHQHQVKPTQVLLRYLTQQGIVTIPMTTNHQHLVDNLASLDFDLSTAELASLRQFDRGLQSMHWPSWMREDAY